ncbi:MAG: 6-bladed beta-propeller [Candidatus Aminicenantes bacterium]
MNPEKPLKGTVLLDIEKTLEINPYKFEEVGFKHFRFARDADGEVILLGINQTEVHRFTQNGEYLGSLVRKGQGPGEFPDFSGLQIYFMNHQIWITGRHKLAQFDKNGQFIQEKKLGYNPEPLINDRHFFVDKKRLSPEKSEQKILLVDLSPEGPNKEKETLLFQAENVGMIWGPERRGLMEDWATPFILNSYDKENQKAYIVLNTDYKIHVKNLKAETLYVIEKPHKNVRVDLDDKKEILSRYLERGESSKWMLSAYPDALVAIKDLKILPGGFVAVYRVAGLKIFEIDVFDKEGNYLYVMKPPEGVSLENAEFYNFGFALTEMTEDGFQIYVEYRIKNLPDIFKD